MLGGWNNRMAKSTIYSIMCTSSDNNYYVAMICYLVIFIILMILWLDIQSIVYLVWLQGYPPPKIFIVFKVFSFSLGFTNWRVLGMGFMVFGLGGRAGGIKRC